MPIAQRAVVLGAGMGGLLAARVLADRFAEVVVVDRDELAAGGTARTGVPQGRHIHVLLARGREILDQHFPGFTAEVVSRGGMTGDLAARGRYYMNGGWLAQYDSGLTLLFASRPLLEDVVRSRVGELANVRILGGHNVLGLRADGAVVTGVRLGQRGDDAGERESVLDADLVVDSTGRGASAVSRLRELGYPSPEEDQVGIDLTYVSRTFRRSPGQLDDTLLTLVTPSPPDRRAAGVIAQEGDLWTVMLGGYLGERPPADLAGFTAYAAGLPVPEVADLLATAEPVGEPAVAHFAASRRRRFEKLSAFPERYLVFGDAISSFTPIYGQGMTVAAEESLALAKALDAGLDGLAGRFLPAAARIIDVPWLIAAANDFRFPEATGRRALEVRLLNGYFGRLQRAARHDSTVAQAFFRTINLLDRPQGLLQPSIAARVLSGGRVVGRAGSWLPRQRTHSSDHDLQEH